MFLDWIFGCFGVFERTPMCGCGKRIYDCICPEVIGDIDNDEP